MDMIILFIAVLPHVTADDVTEAITLSCHSSHMAVDVDMRYFTSSIDPHSLHLQDRHCRPHSFDKTKASFRVPLQGCGTSRLRHDHLLIFSNAVRNSDGNITNEVSRVPQIRLPFGCRYQNRYSFVLRGGGGTERSAVFKRKETKTAVPSEENKDRIFLVSSSHAHGACSFVLILSMLVAYKADFR
ncbi:CUB and zona pellucida-like domain-containing protein 1 [Exaiptasia diaphana]|uniref:ZP domain-containing protein n=1 Tax=Exaiptasia diaphana TaxID=2652724 RepID=A0A913WZJ2_EXADI|nr:CUB and zona pellucida-like domain-containing protein 1 [Exaiptasia diaphana]KXJ20831.1 hypothetical protein AC249_AIPGENE15723 [Exaiptasia diaphana]